MSGSIEAINFSVIAGNTIKGIGRKVSFKMILKDYKT